MQIDLRHLEKADDPEEPEWPIIDHLVKVLPKKNGKPYLAVFALTHPDKDHTQGFAELLKKVPGLSASCGTRPKSSVIRAMTTK